MPLDTYVLFRSHIRVNFVHDIRRWNGTYFITFFIYITPW